MSAEARPSSQGLVVAVALLGLGAVAVTAGGFDGRLAIASLIGAVGGFALYKAAFGFTGGWRQFQRFGRGDGVRAQLLLMGVAATLAFPLLALGTGDGPLADPLRDLGLRSGGWVFPMGVASAIGAAMFGFGMQLGGGCGSGTLFTVGGGSTRMVLTLTGFLAGSVAWTASFDWWQGLPRLPAVSLIATWGPIGAWLATLGALGVLAGLTLLLERRRSGRTAGAAPGIDASARSSAVGFLCGPWSLTFGAVVLAAVVVATILTLGRPWGITSAYPLWGAKLGDAIGLPITAIPYWTESRLARSIFADATSVMNFGVVLGALVAAGLAGRFAPAVRLTERDVATALIGGILMGYGARLGFGCNIGGMVGGIVSASLHGWWWLLFGALGSVVGVWTRGWIGMDPPRAASIAKGS